MTLDLSPEAVEQLLHRIDNRCGFDVMNDHEPCLRDSYEAADVIRALTAEHARLRAERDAAWQAGAKAMREYGATAEYLGSCGDGGCLVLRQTGQHTNGGCRCNTDGYKAQRMMLAGQRLANAIRALPLPDQPKEGTQ